MLKKKTYVWLIGFCCIHWSCATSSMSGLTINPNMISDNTEGKNWNFGQKKVCVKPKEEVKNQYNCDTRIVHTCDLPS